MGRLTYKMNHKLELAQEFVIDLDKFVDNGGCIWPTLNDERGRMSIDRDSVLRIKKGFKWDGASGPTIDTENVMRAALVHDALYRLIRNRYLGISYRKDADIVFKNILIADGTNRLRAWYFYQGVRMGGKSSAMPVDGKMAVCIN